MHFFESKKKNILPLYNKIVSLTRKNFFYKDLQLSDSFSIRIYLLFFHLCFIIIALKKKFDPNFHQAMTEIEDNKVEPGTIVQEIQKGYMMKDRLLRPSFVGVTKKRVEKSEKTTKDKQQNEKK